MSGRLGDLAGQQIQSLESLRCQVQESKETVPQTQTSDLDLLRFLRARSFNVNAAFKQWKACQEWRKTFGAPDVLDGPYPLEQELKYTLSFSYNGHDMDHRPLYVERSGAVDPLVIARLNPDEVIRRHIYHQELQVRRTEENARQFGNEALDSWCEIHDMRGLSIQHRQVLSLFTRLARIDSDYYPERAGRIFFINVPAVFPALWKICKRALDSKTREKFVVISANKTGELLDYFTPDQLPAEYGGAVEGLFPVSAAARRPSRPLTGVKFQEAHVLARRRNLKVFNCEAGDVVMWYFSVVSKDVKFSVHWNAGEPPVTQDNPVHASHWLERATPLGDTCIVSASSDGLSDTHFCSEKGYIGMVWENESIIQNRTVTYQVSIDHSSKYDGGEGPVEDGDEGPVEVEACVNGAASSHD